MHWEPISQSCDPFPVCQMHWLAGISFLAKHCVRFWQYSCLWAQKEPWVHSVGLWTLGTARGAGWGHGAHSCTLNVMGQMHSKITQVVTNILKFALFKFLLSFKIAETMQRSFVGVRLLFLCVYCSWICWCSFLTSRFEVLILNALYVDSEPLFYHIGSILELDMAVASP